MYDTERRVALVKQRVRENTRRRQRHEAISLSAACMLLFAVLMQAADALIAPGQTAAWGSFGAMLLREDAGGYVLVAKGCSGGTDALAGTWEFDGTTTYSFDGSGSGTMELPSISYDFTYTIDGNKLMIDYANESVRDSEYEFTVDGNTLTLIGDEGTVGGTYELKRSSKK